MLLSEVLRLFSSPLSQEQCWAVCHGVCSTLIDKRSEDRARRERIKYIINLESLVLTQRGEIDILHSEPSYQEWQKDAELIFAVGNVLCQCLDYGLSEIEICEVKFRDDLAELIGGMVFQNQDELDEGIDQEHLGDSWSSQRFPASARSFLTLDEVVRFCEGRLLRRNVSNGGLRYIMLCRALFVEVSELKAFLGHVLNDFGERHCIQGTPDGPQLAKQYVQEWAKLWIQVMSELRNKAKKRNSADPSYEYSPLDVLSLSTNDNLRVRINKHRALGKTPSLPLDAEEKIFDFLRMRAASQEGERLYRKTGLKAVGESTSSGKCLSVRADAVSLESATSCQHKQASGKLSIVGNPSWPSSHKLDSISVDSVEEEFLKGQAWIEGGLGVEGSADESRALHFTNCIVDRRSLEAVSDSFKTREMEVDETFDLDLPKTRDDSLTRASTCRVSGSQGRNMKETHLRNMNIEDEDGDRKIGSSLVEIFKIRQELVRAEMDFINDADVLNDKKCFGCRKCKFSIFQRVKLCGICNKRYCVKCLDDRVSVSGDLADALPPNIDVSYNARETSQSQDLKSLSKTMLSMASGGPRDGQQLRWLAKRHSAAVRLSMCHECKKFLEMIESEKRRVKWRVQLQLNV